MMRSLPFQAAVGAISLLASLLLVGCSGTTSSRDRGKTVTDEEIRAAREKLSPEERAQVEQQEWCVVSTDQRLGSMGVPHKVTVKDQTVFLCCDHCAKKALADPDKTLATLASHKQRAKEQRGGKGM